MGNSPTFRNMSALAGNRARRSEYEARQVAIYELVSTSKSYLEKGNEVVETLNALRASLHRPPLRFDFDSKFSYLDQQLPMICQDAFRLKNVPERIIIVNNIVKLLIQWENDLIKFFELIIDNVHLTLEHIDAKNALIAEQKAKLSNQQETISNQTQQIATLQVSSLVNHETKQKMWNYIQELEGVINGLKDEIRRMNR